MNILLINPPWHRFLGERLNDYPIGLCYLAACLEKTGYNAKVYNADSSKNISSVDNTALLNSYQRYLDSLHDLNNLVWQEVKSIIARENPDIIGISVMTPKYGSAVTLAKLAKQINSNIKIIFGGWHPTIYPDETIKNKYVDVIVRGEGEETIVELAKAFDEKLSLENIKGISYKNNGKIIHNDIRPLMPNLNKAPFPARHLLLNKEYLEPFDWGRLFTSRGCPYNCIFCASNKIWERKVRYRSVKNVIDEIKQVKKEYGTNYFYFEDDSFTLNKKYVQEVCELMKMEKLGITWSCETRADLVTDELIKTMKSAGCISIVIGAESGNDEILKKIKKGITVSQIINAAKIIRRHGIKTSVFFMIGLPWETEKEIYDTVKLMKKISPLVSVFSIATPYPGTELYNICKSENLIPDIEWEGFFHQSPEMYLCKLIPKERFDTIIKNVSKTFDKHNKFKRRMLLFDIRYLFIKLKQLDMKNPVKFILGIKRYLGK